MSLEAEYVQLGEKLAELNQQRAVLLAKEQEKTRERTELEKQLREAGINVNDPEGEIKRLETLLQQDFEKTKSLVDEFEERIKKLWPETPRTEPAKVVSMKPVTDDTLELT